MKLWIVRCFLALLFVLPLWAEPLQKSDKEKKVEATVIVQRSNGFPGTKATKRRPFVLQKVYVYRDRMAIVDLEPPKRVRIVRLDKKVVWELIPEKKLYVETPFRKFREIYEKRERDRKRLWKAITESRLSAEKKRKRLAEEGLSEDGEDRFHTSATGKKRIYLGNFECEQWLVKRNNLPLLEAWVSPKIAFPPHLLRFYEQLGLFGPEEVKAFRKIPGFPLVLTLWVDLGMKGTYRISTQVLQLTKEKVPLSRFELPSDYRKYTPPKPQLKCPLCGKKVTTKRYRVAWKGKIYYCCSKKHQIRWMVQLVRRKKRGN